MVRISLSSPCHQNNDRASQCFKLPDFALVSVAGPCSILADMNMQHMNSCGCTFVVVFLYPTIPSLMSVVKCVPVYISLGLYNTTVQFLKGTEGALITTDSHAKANATQVLTINN